jgi:hypothetical protein
MVALGAYGPYVVRGGFIHDDWSVAATYQFNTPGFWQGITTGLDTAGRHPVSGIYTGFVYEVFGLHQHLHLAWLALMGLVTSLLLFMVLRRVGVGTTLSLTVAILVLVFPGSDAGRLWISGAGSLAVLLLLAGMLLALTGLQAGGWRSVALHAGALLFYLAALLTYDVALAALLGTGLVYRLCASWRRVAGPWLADVVLTVCAAVYVRGGTSKTIETNGSALSGRFSDNFDGARQLIVSLGGSLGWEGAPVRVSWTVTNAVLMVGLAVLAVGLWRGRSDRDLRVAAGMGAYGVLLVAAASAVLLVVEGYSNRGAGIYNRVNVLAGVGYVLVLVGTAVTAILLTGMRTFWSRAAPAAAVFVCVVFGALFVARLRVHEDRYVQSVRAQRAALDTLGRLPVPSSGSVVFVTGVRAQIGPGVPVFQATWDLTGALRLLWNTDAVDAVPAGTLDRLVCRDDGVLPVGPLYSSRNLTHYPDALFVDVRTGRTLRPRTRAQCEKGATWFMGWLREA